MSSIRESVNKFQRKEKLMKGLTTREAANMAVILEREKLSNLEKKQRKSAFNTKERSLTKRLSKLPNFKPKVNSNSKSKKHSPTLNNMFNNNNVSKGYGNPILEATVVPNILNATVVRPTVVRPTVRRSMFGKLKNGFKSMFTRRR